MKKFIIYLRRNKVNGKCYVGQTSNFKQREREWRCLKRSYTNKYIDEDRAKYGFDAWTVEVLAEADTREEAWELEQRFINDYNTLWPNGYNISTGGYGGSGVKLSDETIKKLSEAKKGKPSPMKGKHFSDEHKKKLSDAHPKKQVYQFTLDGELVKIWSSTMECGRNGFDQGHISKCCNGKKKIYKGHKWSYAPL